MYIAFDYQFATVPTVQVLFPAIGASMVLVSPKDNIDTVAFGRVMVRSYL
jgi:hypothetical protein